MCSCDKTHLALRDLVLEDSVTVGASPYTPERIQNAARCPG